MTERLPAPGPVETGPLTATPAPHLLPRPGGGPECHAWFPPLAAAAAWQSRPIPVSLALTALLDGTAVPLAPFLPADAAFLGATPAEAAALCAALACPDVAVIDAPAGPDQLRLAAELAVACRRRGERVLLLCAESIDADKLVVRLRDAGETSILRALAPGEPANQLPAASAERVARAHGERSVEKQRAKLQQASRDAADRVSGLERPGEPDAPPPQLAEAADRLAAARQARADAERDARQHCEAKKPAGWVASVKRLFAADDGPAAEVAVDARLAELDRDIAARQAEADALQAAADAGRARELADARRAAAEATAALARFEADAPTLARRLIDAAAIVVGPAAAYRADAALQPPARFHVAVVADVESLADAELLAAWALAGRRVLLGDGAARRRTPGTFARLLDRLHAPALHLDHAKMTARLLPVPAGAALDCEPLADQPEVELRFLRPAAGGEPQLAQVAFPANFAIAAAKAFLARELGACFVRLAGVPEWAETADAIEARVPGTAAGGECVDLGDGVREELTGPAADCWTAAVRFDRAAGWTPESARARLAELAPTPRAARLPRLPAPTEYAPARRPAVARG